MSTEQVSKRVVLAHTTGRLAGLHQIIGKLHAPADVLAKAIVPSLLYGVNGQQRAIHQKTTTRYVLYREWAALPSGRFGDDLNPMQR